MLVQNTNVNRQNNMPPPGANNATIMFSTKSSLAEAQDKDLERAIMNMFKCLEKAMNTCLSEDWKTTNSGRR